MIFWFFGFPGTGKDFCAKVLSSLINAEYIHVDDFLTEKDREKLIDGSFTTEDRLNKLKRTADKINKILKKKEYIVAADSLPDHQSRNFLFESFKDNITFIHVVVCPDLHKKRIKERKNHFFTDKLLDNWIKKHWAEPIKIPYIALENNKKGVKNIKAELIKIINSIKNAN